MVQRRNQDWGHPFESHQDLRGTGKEAETQWVGMERKEGVKDRVKKGLTRPEDQAEGSGAPGRRR